MLSLAARCVVALLASVAVGCSPVVEPDWSAAGVWLNEHTDDTGSFVTHGLTLRADGTGDRSTIVVGPRAGTVISEGTWKPLAGVNYLTFYCEVLNGGLCQGVAIMYRGCVKDDADALLTCEDLEALADPLTYQRVE